MQWLKQGGTPFFSRTEEVGTGVAAATCRAGRARGSSDLCFVILKCGFFLRIPHGHRMATAIPAITLGLIPVHREVQHFPRSHS